MSVDQIEPAGQYMSAHESALASSLEVIAATTTQLGTVLAGLKNPHAPTLYLLAADLRERALEFRGAAPANPHLRLVD